MARSRNDKSGIPFRAPDDREIRSFGECASRRGIWKSMSDYAVAWPRLLRLCAYARRSSRGFRHGLIYALRFALRFRPLVLRAAPRADAALRVVFFALFLFFDVIG